MDLNRSKETRFLPEIIQGGMGFYISSPFLARAVSMCGQLGTASGVGADILLARILQNGDPGGHFRRALAHFPFQHVAQRVIEAFYEEGGIPQGVRYKGKPVFTVKPSDLLVSLTICANYAFVYLAKEGHSNPVSINYMEKIAMPIPFAMVGGMLAGVNFVTMGAGIPRQIPDLIDAIAEGRTLQYEVPVLGDDGKVKRHHTMSFDPKTFFGSELPPLKKPGFIPIVASNALATYFATKFEGRVYGLVVEEETAGGHNAPPRDLVRDATGRPLPIYGQRDVVDYRKVAALGLPFWIGGSRSSPEQILWAKSVGAVGAQCGGIFALSDESGMDPKLRRKLREQGFRGKLIVRTDMDISPTGYPFQLVELEETISDPSVYEKRPRVCSQCALVDLYDRPNGTIGYRCPAEPEDKYASKGGDKDTRGVGCLCNGLMATAGMGDKGEPPVVTLGKYLGFLPKLIEGPESSYGVKQAIDYLLGTTT